jgi:hypothetical protein
MPITSNTAISGCDFIAGYLIQQWENRFCVMKKAGSKVKITAKTQRREKHIVDFQYFAPWRLSGELGNADF